MLKRVEKMNATKKYSLSEISKHNSKEDCWLIIHGKVFNVTSFLEDHPGGEDVLLQVSANGDATESFEDVGHSSTATSMMDEFLIGTVEGHVSLKPNQTATGDSVAAEKFQKRKLEASSSSSFMDILLPLLILALAFAAWYYLTFINVNA